MNINMRADTSAVTVRSMFHHIPVLRTYARRTVLLEEQLSPSEERDRNSRVQEFLKTGESLNWTQKEMIVLLLRDVFAVN